MYKERIQKLQNLLQDISADAFLIEDLISLYYLTGLDISAGKILVHTKGAHLIVDNRYFEMVQKKSSFPVILQETGILLNILSTPDFSFIKTLAFNSEKTTYSRFIALKSLEKVVKILPAENLVEKLRMTKDPEEITILREAAELGSQGYDYLVSLLKEGITEAELAVELEIFWKRKGSKALAFDPIIAFGANSSMPHYRVGNEKLLKGMNVLFDIGVNYKHYHSDMTRVVFFGEPDPKIIAIYEIVQKAQQAALTLCKPGTKIGELDSATRAIIESEGYGEHFTHSLGHGVGLEIHETPILRNRPPFGEVALKEGMVITIEPGIYLPGLGGVRIEDTVAITEKGHENLTNRTKDFEEVQITDYH